MRHVQSVGIDVSKSKVDVALLFADGTHHIHSFSNTLAGAQECIDVFKQQGVTEVTPCIVESTGDYHLLIAITVTRAKFTVNVINPIITKQYQKSSIRDAKTDTIDALRLARVGILEEGLLPFSANLQAIGAKKLLSLISKLEKTRQQLAASMKQFQAAKESLGLLISCHKMEGILLEINEQLADLYAQVEKVSSQKMQAFAEATPGLSSKKATLLEAVIAGKTFENRNQLVAYVGLDIRKRESGQWHGKEHISKRGNSYARKILFQIAWGLKQHNQKYRDYYEQLRSRGKHYYTCMLALARKFLRFFFAYYFQGTVQLSTAI